MKTTLFLSTICLAFGYSTANAGIITDSSVQLNSSNTAFPFTGPYGVVTLHGDTGTGQVTISLAVAQLPARDGDLFQEFGFNTNVDASHFASVTTSTIGAGGAAWTVDGPPANQIDGFGDFDFDVAPGSQPGQNRAAQVDVLVVFNALYKDEALVTNFLKTNADGHQFVAHLLPFDSNILTGYVGDGPSEIPGVSEPASVLLFGFGALGMFGLRFRRRRQQTEQNA